MNQQHIKEKDKQRKRAGWRARQLKRKCVQQLELEEHTRKEIRREEQQGDTQGGVDNGLSMLANVASSAVPVQGPSVSPTLLPPSSAPIVVLSSTGPPSEPKGDGSSSEVDEDNPQPVLRLRGGGPEDLDDEEAFYEQDQIAQPVIILIS